MTTEKAPINSEKDFVENLFSHYITSNDSSYLRLIRVLLIRTFTPFIKGGRALELGCEIGYMSQRIAALVDNLDIVDGSEQFINEAKKRNIVNANYYCSLFEDFEPEPIYEYVFASHILEHLIDVPRVLRMVKSSLKSGGYFFVAVPNAQAVSRQLARHMGLLDSLYDLTPNDIRGGHRRVYDRVTLTRDIETAGFDIVSQGGLLFKPFADFQMDKLIDIELIAKPQIEGLLKLGHEYPDMCGVIYMIASPKQ